MNNKILNIIGLIAVAIAVIFAYRGNKMNVGIKFENMDLSYRPGDDFYDYAAGNWMSKNPIPDDQVVYGSFHVLRDLNLERVRKIAESDNGKIGALYKIAMDDQKLNADGISPVRKIFANIDAIKSKDELAKYLGNAHRFSGGFWGDGVALDEMNSEYYIYNIGQSGVSLSRDYYFDDDKKSVEIRAKYKQYIGDLCANFEIKCDANALYKFEESIAKSFHTKEVLRDPHANYHKMTMAEFKKKFTGFNWADYFAARGAAPLHINVNQPGALSESLRLINETDLNMIKAYLKFRIANSAASVLDDKTYGLAFDFYNKTLSGQKEQKPRWKRAVAMLNGSLGEEIGHLYVEKYFPNAARERMTELVENLRRGYALRIKNLDWMSDQTKARALEKLAGFKAKIGYPDVWRDYSKLEIGNDSLFENMLRVSQFEDQFWLDKIEQKADPTIWHMNAHEVNAYYDPSTNEICFPAGILQYPFFDMNADDAFNYGAIGSVIGHEMTHGFDDQGRKFDKDGNLKDWWTQTDGAAFDRRAKVMRDFFDKIEVAPNVHANGEFTLGENLADYGGITIALTAYKNYGKQSETTHELTPAQRFFIAYATCETSNIREDELLRRTKEDEHSLSRWRVNGILPHIPDWYEAFGIIPGDKMYIAPSERVKIW